MLNNQTITDGFQIVAFSTDTTRQPVLFTVFLLMYLTGVLENAVILTLILLDKHLHTPMYIFLWNLSAVDICYLNVTLPKLMDILLTGDNYISFVQCFTQMYFYNSICSTEIVLLSVMAYDRYVAICNPLRYHLIMNKKKIVLLLCVIWGSGSLNSLPITSFASHLSFCHSHTIRHFYCDCKAVSKIACSVQFFNEVMYIVAWISVPVPFLLSFLSYVKIVKSILHIRSADSRKKCFSTCTSHLTVLTLFYGTIMCVYMAPFSGNSEILDQVLSVLYTTVTPMLNPLIYSLQNKDVARALSQNLVKKIIIKSLN
ncbi:olfactory receptor 1500-like [Mixophyes fleayi]|uniref:olfactory receptor 1500-like n=1 Tax=Mixophyes fleayi TaxID=3061075 RepID=UPI003F4E33E2